MSEPVIATRITATEAAREAIRQLRAVHGGPVMFVQSAGCCAGSTPMCFADGEYLVGAGDTLLGEVDGCPFYIDDRLDAALGRCALVLDVAPGAPEGFSLAAGEGRRFVSRPEKVDSPVAVRPRVPVSGAGERRRFVDTAAKRTTP